MILDLHGLGFPPRELEQFDQLIHKPYGMILVTGPTGSGKTTTLYAALESINSSEKKIITIEDPVEYRLAGVTQMQVKSSIGLTFARALRHIVRQDPDVVLVGEIRDRETAEIAVHAALTGHLVFSTLHTNDAAGAITRLLEMGIEDFLLASAILGILAQRLVRLICPECRTALPPGLRGGRMAPDPGRHGPGDRNRSNYSPARGVRPAPTPAIRAAPVSMNSCSWMMRFGRLSSSGLMPAPCGSRPSVKA